MMISRITDTPISKILYKYRDWRNKYHRNLITKQEIYFPKPSEFNDPFDGNIPVRWDLMTYEDCLEKNLEIINTVHSDKNQQLVREYAKKITDEKTLWHPDKLVKERTCVFRSNPDTDSGRSRTPIPINSGHSFRLKTDT